MGKSKKKSSAKNADAGHKPKDNQPENGANATQESNVSSSSENNVTSANESEGQQLENGSSIGVDNEQHDTKAKEQHSTKQELSLGVDLETQEKLKRLEVLEKDYAVLKALSDKLQQENEKLKNETPSRDPDMQMEQLVEKLKSELKIAQEERDAADERYEDLRGKVSHIKTTLGERLRTDAQELETSREEVRILSAQNGELQKQIDALKNEAVSSCEESDRLSHELAALRAELRTSSEKWSVERDQLLQEKRNAVDAREKIRLLEVAMAEERAARDNVASSTTDLEEQVSVQTAYAERFRIERDELRSKLTDKEVELTSEREAHRTAYGKLEMQHRQLEETLTAVHSELANARTRAAEAEELAKRVPTLEAECKEKNLLIGKLRHEAVILNEHLTKSLRMIRKNSEGETVDKELISNLIISFLNIPRGDAKKFEVLQLISSFLGWDDEQKIHAGLSRPANAAMMSPHLGNSRVPSSTSLSDADPTGAGSVSSVIGLFAEFLERESSKK